MTYLHEVVIDQIDDLQVPGQDAAKHICRPALKSLWQDGVVGVSAAAIGDVPGLRNSLRIMNQKVPETISRAIGTLA